MPLTVLKTTPATSPTDLVRLFHQSQLEWSRHLGEETELEYGRWICNAALLGIAEANCLLDAFLVGRSAASVIDDITARSTQAGALWQSCTLNPSMPGTDDLAAALLSDGWTARPMDILYRNRAVRQPRDFISDLTVIPARASFRHYRQLMEQRSPADADAAMLHLDDSHLDALLALRAGQPVGCIGVLTSGEMGTIREWYVTPGIRNQGIGRVLLDRAMEICTRSVLRHVMIGLPPEAATTRALCAFAGFTVIGEIRSMHRPAQTKEEHDSPISAQSPPC